MDLKIYKRISKLIMISFILNSIILIVCNLKDVDYFLLEYMNNIKLEIMKQFFFGALGATIACSLFLKEDKEINELEEIEDKPDPKILRFPDSVDIQFYIHRILTSGILAVLGSLIILGGFSYLEVDYHHLTIRHKILFAISSLLIGIYQGKFLTHLTGIFDRFFRKKDTDSEDDSDK